ncbi:hypothetical protein JOF42_000342 [Microbacterium phyllosphaerae]|uniref:Uncharacterized protein n=1 Tax=Microbacterium phyllosphaerae TaxID=124798 RepID=A0ABS4WKW5_9MICO|nr:hypothetical protein [Microbacterium phyllosphaerae]MBP2376847.1 hypothetical protein [Microbacterium phyllosphaerae]
MTTDHEWVARRVDTIRFVDGERLERRVTLDLDLVELRRRAKAARLRQGNVPIPLLTLSKGPLLDIDVMNVRGESLAIATRDQDAHAASAMLLAVLARNGISIGKIPDTVLEQLYSITRDTDPIELEHVAYTASPSAFPSPPSDGLIRFSAADTAAWARMLSSTEFVDGLFDYADSFMLLSHIDLRQPGDVAIVKIRLLEERNVAETRTSWFSPDRLGWRPQTQRIPMWGVGRAQRNHVRVLAPEESTVRSTRWFSDDETLKRVRDGRDTDGQAPLDRATFYDSGLPPADYRVEIDLEPARGPFLVPAALTTGLLLFLVGMATLFQWMDGRFSWAPPTFVFVPDDTYGWRMESIQTVQANFDAAVTVLAIVPSLVAIYIVRAGEHKLVTRLMTIPRLLVLASAFAAIVCGGATAASVQRGSLLLVYSVGLGVVLVAFISVLIPIVRVSWFRHKRRRLSVLAEESQVSAERAGSE